MSDTIFALATAAGRGAVAVIRLSGPTAGSAIESLTGYPLPQPRVATRMKLRDPGSGETLDDALVLWFPAPRSYTGEDVAELHLHGGRAVSAGVVGTLATMKSLRAAEPGEFTRRAFVNGKMDLTEAEAIADLVDAETAAQRRQALRQMDGEFGRLCESWREKLVKVLAYVEADIDFSDEDLPEGLGTAQRGEIEALARDIAGCLEDGHKAESLREGLSVAIVGAPNAGKSSLLNAIARREAAIVSARAGTTRDVIEVHLDLGGYPVILADTAGLRETTDEIEEEGVRRALVRATHADVKIAVFDATTWPNVDKVTRELLDENAIAVLNKADLNDVAETIIDTVRAIAVSAKTGAGLEALEKRLIGAAKERLTVEGGGVMTRARHRGALEECRESLLRAVVAPLPELAAEDVRMSMRALGRITGRVDVEDLLDVIFRDFCIGK